MKRLIMTLAAVSFALLTSAASASAADGDADGIDDSVDNCAAVANADQFDADLDGRGNACDADYNNDGVVDGIDQAILEAAFGSVSGDADFDPALDHDGDGRIAGSDFTVFIRIHG